MSLNSKILARAAAHERWTLPPEIETLVAQVELTDDVRREARSVLGMTLSALEAIDRDRTRAERRRKRALGDLRDPQTAVLAATIPERVFRPDDPTIQHEALREVVKAIGIPKGLPWHERGGLGLTASPLGRLVMNRVRAHIRARVGDFVEIVDHEDPEVVVSNLPAGSEINLVTEAAVSEAEAKRNLQWYVAAIKAGAERIAIKPTALVPLSTNPIATAASKKKLAKALREIFYAADVNPLPDGRTTEISIDSEQSGLLEMTRDAVLEAAQDFPNVRIKIAMQSYLRDTETRLLDPFLEASHERVKQQGVPLGARLVCGANMEGEEWMASLGGWGETPLTQSRAATHANYLRLMRRMLDPLKTGEFTVTVGTMNLITLMHNLMGLAKAGVFAAEHGGAVSFAMLRGMTGPEVFRYLKKEYGMEGHEYVPVIPLSRIVELFKYYLRRIEEIGGGNGEVANWLGVTCQNGTDSEAWRETQARGYLESLRVHRATDYPLMPGVLPNRGEYEPIVKPTSLAEFKIVPVIQTGAPEMRAWIDDRIRNCKTRTDSDAPAIGPGWKGARAKVPLRGPTRPDLLLAKIEQAGQGDINHAFSIAEQDPAHWGTMCPERRVTIIAGAVDELRKNREALVESLMLNIGKSVPEADAEVNEAIDFVNLSVLQTRELLQRHHLEIGTEGNETAVVVCPKNFPIAIPLAHIIARLIAGYRVIVKPSGGEGEEAVLPTWEMVKCLWAAGVPKDALIFLPCDNAQAAYLTSHPNAERIGFTGSTGTAAKIHAGNAKVDLLAETGGRNIAILDSTADLKEVALSIVRSVCGFAGQKCSKLRAVIATKDVDMAKFRGYLVEIMNEMLVGSPLVPHVDCTPLSKVPHEGEPLHQALTQLLPGEKWVEGAEPKELGRPGIREVADLAKFDWQKLQEIFAPVFTITQIEGGVEEAITIANNLPGSLTGALWSRNDRAIEQALAHWKTGNLYINREPTGARADQGFGDGTGDSHRGAHGAKTGTQEFLLMNACVRRRSGSVAYEHVEEDSTGVKAFLAAIRASTPGRSLYVGSKNVRELTDRLTDAGRSYLYEAQTYFSHKRPAPYQVKGQDDWIESRPIGHTTIRASMEDDLEEVVQKVLAGIAAGNRVLLSVPFGMLDDIRSLGKVWGIELEAAFPNLEIRPETDDGFADWVEYNHYQPQKEHTACINYCRRTNVPEAVWRAAAQKDLHIDCRPVTGDGRNDLITQYRQQSYCWVHHTAGDDSFEQWRRKRAETKSQ